MVKQLSMKFPNEQVKSLLKKYLSKEIKIGCILEILSIKRSRFFELSIFLGFSLNSVGKETSGQDYI